MYLAHYGLNEPPFSITPDPRFVFLSERHRDALAHLLFGIDQGGSGGFVQLTGEVGTGKTTLCRMLLEQLPDKTRAALVLNPQLSPVELIETICEELRLDLADEAGSPRRASLKSRVDLLNAYLLDAYAQGLRVVLIIDEAQNLSIDALEQVRLLTNLETPSQKLLQIILLGQPELRAMLARDDLRQLAQRITARFHLTPLDADETGEYLRHRWRVAGGQRFPFTAGAIKRIHRHSGGVPRLINVIAERTLLAGYAHDETSLGERWVDRAAREALAPAPRRWLRGPHAFALGAVAVAAVGLLALAAALWLRSQPGPVAAAATTTTASPPPAAASIASPPAAVTTVPFLDAQTLAQRLQDSDPSVLPAWRQMLELWQLPAEDADAARAANCLAPVAADVHCARGLADLDKLARQGHPALVHLRSNDQATWALLLGIDAVNVRLRLGNDVVDTDRIAFERLWNGEYAALWRVPPALSAGLSGPLGPGASGPVVEWVGRQLRPRYLPPADGLVRFDAAMAGALRDYQRAHGLASDGVIGPETLMAMAPNEAGPHLLRVLE
ncbi:AAA family ATPase [Novilysobacter erysipheiresistens]|uniref:AAA family ATPase n=1 Tax=Novilysobacter erysipheiresistens TaxID=1749332 RepID=A0ABU7YWZ2_9GAMM